MNGKLINDVVEYMELSELTISKLSKEAAERESELGRLRSLSPGSEEIRPVVEKLARAGMLDGESVDEASAKFGLDPKEILRRLDKAAERIAGRPRRGVLGRVVERDHQKVGAGKKMRESDRVFLTRLGFIS